MLILTKAETSAIIRHSLITNARELFGEKVTRKIGMKTMIILLYLMSLAGVYVQAVQVIPGLPDVWASGVTIGLLIIANAVLWRHLVKTEKMYNERLEGYAERLEEAEKNYGIRLAQMQQEHQIEREKQSEKMMILVRDNQEAIQEILRSLK